MSKPKGPRRKNGKLKCEPIEALDVTAEELEQAYVADKWITGQKLKEPVAVKPVVLGEKLYVQTGGWQIIGDTEREWNLQRLYTAAEFTEKFPDEKPRLVPRDVPNDADARIQDAARRERYFGTRVRFGKVVYVIGPRSEQRIVVRQAKRKTKVRA